MLKKSWLYIKRHWLPHIFAFSAKMGLRLLLKTCRVRIHGLETFVKTAEKSPCMLMLWHNRFGIGPVIVNSHAAQFSYTAFMSKSRDGDPLALVAESYKTGRALRVPHNGRHLALSQMIDALKIRREIMIITPDGPRGPRFIVKPGVAMAAKEAGAHIFPFSWNATRFWQLNTWDHMTIPKPFSTIDVVFGDPVQISKDNSLDYQEEVSLLKTSLDSISPAQSV